MKNVRRQFGLTLTELLVTVAIAVVLMSLAIPATRRITESLHTSAGARGLIAAALGNARAIAVREGAYAGVRFQRAADGQTYMVFIVHDYNATGLANGFRVLDGRKPMALPENVGVLAGSVYSDAMLVTESGWVNANTISVVYNSAGKLVLHDVRVWNKHGKTDNTSNDTIFNTKTNVDNGIGMFYQDDDSALGLEQEPSVNSLRIYDKTELAAVNPALRWTGYLNRLNIVMISPYTGELIGE